jgi:DNA-binding PadR family transcriptional regulator
MIDREFIRGFVKLYSLWRASKNEVCGAQIFDEMRALGFHLSAGTIYPTLHKLLRENDVTATSRIVNGRIRKFYRLTRKGRRELEEVQDRLKAVVRKVFT